MSGCVFGFVCKFLSKTSARTESIRHRNILLICITQVTFRLKEQLVSLMHLSSRSYPRPHSHPCPTPPIPPTTPSAFAGPIHSSSINLGAVAAGNGSNCMNGSLAPAIAIVPPVVDALLLSWVLDPADKETHAGGYSGRMAHSKVFGLFDFLSYHLCDNSKPARSILYAAGFNF